MKYPVRLRKDKKGKKWSIMRTRGEKKKQGLFGFFKALFFPQDFLSVSGKDPYKILKIKVVVLDAILSLVPLLVVVTVSYFWFQNILKDDFRSQLKWQVENSKQSVEFFVDENFPRSGSSPPPIHTNSCPIRKYWPTHFRTSRENSAGWLISDSLTGGIQRSYVGPYSLGGKDYSNQDWFHEVVVGMSMSAMFLWGIEDFRILQ